MSTNITAENVRSCSLNNGKMKIKIKGFLPSCAHIISFYPRTAQKVIENSTSSNIPNHSLICKASLTDSSLPKPCDDSTCLIANIEFVGYSKLFGFIWKKCSRDIKNHFKNIEKEAKKLLQGSAGNLCFIEYDPSKKTRRNKRKKTKLDDSELGITMDDPTYKEWYNKEIERIEHIKHIVNGTVDNNLFEQRSTMDYVIHNDWLSG
ncbi:2933_t:CDS:1 [Ambispora leptoticha]|uniref:2933_t:CDS:1 n=1 Tax=Ambispora leptoticha TaxID=144679 RepID=A0A9N9BPW9_9GLOM|nr:2933_t:CDS:1 [Ambispora leptoticha]